MLLQRLEALNIAVGRAVAWLTVCMVIVTIAVVILRYWFDLGWIWLQETVNWMHAAVFMLGASYTLAQDEHVRVDVLYRRLSLRGRAVVDLLGTLLLLMPVCAFVFVSSYDYVATAWRIGEASREAGGLPYPAVPLLKSLIPATAVLLFGQAIVIFARAVLRLRTSPTEHP